MMLFLYCLFLLCLVLISCSPVRVSAIPYTTFGQGISQYQLGGTEQEIFSYTLTSGSTHGVMTHFWCTGAYEIDTSIFSYYLDGETTPSIVFTPYMIVGAGWVDQTAPWGNRWFGKGSERGGWYNNFPIPFQQSIRVTGQLSEDGVNPTKDNKTVVIFAIVRGSENILAYDGSYLIPGTARVHLQKIINYTMQPLDFVNIVDLDNSYSGVIWWTALQVLSGTKNFMEGCYHLFSPVDVPYPGLIVSTGTEDLYDSAYYFNAGQYRNDNAGETHVVVNGSTVYWAAYKFQEVDPLFFNNGVRFVWRNGDTTDTAGHKCTAVNGTKNLNPTVSIINSYAWVYTW